MKKRTSKYLSALMAAIMLIAAMVVPASAASSIEEQMAANSAAWWVAHNAGDTATCEALHQANVALANQAAGSSGSASYNSSAGTWDITTDSGSKISSSGSYSGGKSNTITYTTTTSSGSVSSTSNSTYTSSSINAYKNNGGTNQGLETSYNNAAAKVTSSGNYGSNVAQTTADEEVAVVQELLGLTNAQAKQLQADLETHKQEYESAQAAYEAAMASGNTEAAAAAKEQMNAAHEAAEEVRAEYNYTGDTADVEDGGYYDDWGNPTSPVVTGGGGFYIISSCKITASCNEGGTITPNGVANVKKYSDQKYTIKANEGYFIQSVKIDNVDKGKLESYTFERVTTNHTIAVTFAPKELAISASAGAGGSISPNGTVKVKYGEDKTFTITPNTGYEIKSVTVDGTNKGKLSSFIFNDVKEAHSISATFVKKQFSITASAGAGGKISPSGTATVSYGDDKTYTITPNTGYEIKSVTVDGVNKGKISTYTFDDIKAAHTISATFVKKQFNITASAGTGGSISPNGTSTVSYGDSKTFTITPAQGYKIKSVVVDGVNKGVLTTYTFSNVKAAHSISATFEPSGKVDIGRPDVTDGDGGKVNGGSDGDGIKSGYGIFADVPVSYNDVTELKVVVTYNFGKGAKTVVMEETSKGTFEYPVNAESPLGKRCIYIPVETADGTYTLTFTVTAKNAAGEVLSDTQTATVVVKGNMYEDDFTGDS